MKKLINRLLVGVLLLSMFFIIVFYSIIGLGLSPKLQSLWVTTAMTTLSHKWLATSIISDSRINEIMSTEYVDDTGYDTVISAITVPDVGDFLVYDELTYLKSNTYDFNGYTKLEDGIYLKEVKDRSWRGYILLVSDPLRVKLTDTPKQGVSGTTVKNMVSTSDAIIGVNGGGFNDGPNYDSNGGSVSGLLIIDGEVINPNYDDNDLQYNLIGFNSQGQFILQHCSVEWALANDIQYAVSFSPFLIVNGEGTIKQGSGGWGIAPRTAIGQLKTGEVLFLVIDGRQPSWSIGVDIRVLQDTLLNEGCINAAMMDGGSSTVMVYDDKYVNKPSLGHERFINNAWIVK